ncbi:hypothetical protein CGCSCA5_v007744 [Colletotrichum siamense]|nr:hypothetical protein CGCSCA5_v007744 [Colletotrichum siamense]KAF4874487.1 hypothetical protein CGCSCA1_v006293 [Colletotrichum siamense]
MDRRLDVNAGFKLQARNLAESIDDLLDREKGITNDLLPILWRVNRLGNPMADDQSYKRARDAVFKAVFRNCNTNRQVYLPNPTRERHLTDTTVNVGWLAEDAPAAKTRRRKEKMMALRPTKRSIKGIAGGPVFVKNGSVFPNSIVVTHVPDYYLPRLRTEATMKWDDAE